MFYSNAVGGKSEAKGEGTYEKMESVSFATVPVVKRKVYFSKMILHHNGGQCFQNLTCCVISDIEHDQIIFNSV